MKKKSLRQYTIDQRIRGRANELKQSGPVVDSVLKDFHDFMEKETYPYHQRIEKIKSDPYRNKAGIAKDLAEEQTAMLSRLAKAESTLESIASGVVELN